MSFRSLNPILALSVAVLVLGLCPAMMGAQLNLGGALDKAKDVVQSVAPAAGTATVPSGASELFRKIDQSLDKAERMLSDESANYDKDYRSKEAGACITEARESMETIERRYGTKMGMDHPELTSRRERMTATEAKVKAFQGEMGAAIQSEKAAQETAAQQDAAAETARQEKNAADMAQREEAANQAQAAATAANVGAGKIVFSQSPIDPASPANLTDSFQAGDTIHALIQLDKTWRDLYKAADKTEVGVMVGMEAAGQDEYQYVTLKKPEYIDAKHLALEIAPEPENMKSYKDPDMAFGEGKGNRKIGPIAFTYVLSKLPAGKNTVTCYVRDYGDRPAVGSFTIEGADYQCYAALHEKVKAASDAAATLPPAGMINKDLESQMHALLENTGWSNILRIVIVDKDWWLDGNTLRYLNVAVAAKDGNGECYWCNTQFSQPKLIDGSWGKLELTKTGVKRNIAEENVNK